MMGLNRCLTNGFCSLLLSTLVLAGGFQAAQACKDIVRVTYVEASPDLFVIEYLKDQKTELASVTIDLAPSTGGAFVDNNYGPGQSNAGDAVILDQVLGFDEGAQRGTLTFKRFAPGHRFNMLIDLDDRANGGDHDQDHLNASEIRGGLVTVLVHDPAGPPVKWDGMFDDKGVARIGPKACV